MALHLKTGELGSGARFERSASAGCLDNQEANPRDYNPQQYVGQPLGME